MDDQMGGCIYIYIYIYIYIKLSITIFIQSADCKTGSCLVLHRSTK